MKKYYKLLDLEEGCSKKEIEKRYKNIYKELGSVKDKDVEHIFEQELIKVQFVDIFPPKIQSCFPHF